MKTKVQKLADADNLKSKIPASKLTVFTSFGRTGEKGLSVAQMTELRRLLRSINADYLVTKKTIIDRAVKDSGDVDVLSMVGSLGLAMGKDDAYVTAKKLYEFARKNTALQFFGALFDGKFISNDQFMEMAKMPSKEVLLGRLFGMLKYPLSSLAIVMNEISKKQVPTT
jgi:large subunit ribosomal protein L10